PRRPALARRSVRREAPAVDALLRPRRPHRPRRVVVRRQARRLSAESGALDGGPRRQRAVRSEEMMRRAFSVAVYARRPVAGTLLVTHHRRLDTWLPIGGELEPGETPLEAARRELREETGLVGVFPALGTAVDGEPPGYLGYEEHVAGSK